MEPESALRFPFDAVPATGIAVPVAAGVAWLRMPLPFALDHINLWLLDDGDDGFTAIDTGFALDPVRDAWRAVLGTRRLKRAVVTHGHPDHLGLAAWLEAEFGAPLWMTQGEYATAQLIVEQAGPYASANMVDFFAAHGLDAARCDALTRRGNSFKLGVPSIPRSFRRLYDGDVLAIGKHEWRVIVGHGHCAEHAALYSATLGVLIAGDMLLSRITTNVPALSINPHDDPLARFLDSIDAFTTLPDDTLVLPSHGRLFVGIGERVRQLHAHHADRCARLLAACTAPRSAAELIPVLFDRDIPDPHQVMFAMGEAIAHLNHLEHQGRLERCEDGPTIRYRERRQP